jgi:enoyl-CoA hydratase/carnithine racemase
MSQLPLPVIAAVNGDAVGGGCEIITACDLRIALSSVRFHFAQVKVGLTTGWGGTGRLVSLIGQSRAMELLLTGRTFAAQEALDMGLLHRLVPAGESVLEAALAWADELTQLPREALAATKQLVYASGRLTFLESSQLEQTGFTRLWAAPDHLAALETFLNKPAANP